MKQLKKDLQALSKALKQLTSKTEKMQKMLEKVQSSNKPKAQASVRGRRAAKAAGRAPKKTNATDTVMAVIKKSAKGVNTAILKKKTGFKENNIRAILSRLKKQGKIKTEEKGIYSGA